MTLASLRTPARPQDVQDELGTPVTSMVFSPAADQVAVIHADGHLTVRHVNSGPEMERILNFPGFVRPQRLTRWPAACRRGNSAQSLPLGSELADKPAGHAATHCDRRRKVPGVFG